MRIVRAKSGLGNLIRFRCRLNPATGSPWEAIRGALLGLSGVSRELAHSQSARFGKSIGTCLPSQLVETLRWLGHPVTFSQDRKWALLRPS